MNGIKPKYKVPSMQEIQNTPWNGFNVVSTFSGGGGSCLGYEMAGFHVIWANEFVEEAQKTYKLNHPNTFLDTRDIRKIKPEDILDQTGLKKGQLDLFDGSPPCCAFSTAGKREKNWGKERSYSDGKSQQIETLFYEYIRLLNGLQPKTFVAENVSGLVKGTAIGYFKEFLKEMEKCGYSVKAQLLNSKWLGVPQSRERIIFIGVRNDLNIKPTFPKPLDYYYTLNDAFENVVNDDQEVKMLFESAKEYAWYKVALKLPKNPVKTLQGSQVMNGSYFNLSRQSMFQPCSTVCQTYGILSTAGTIHPLYDRKFSIAELKRIMSVSDDFIVTGTFEQKWERLGRMVPPVMMKNIAKNIEENILRKVE